MNNTEDDAVTAADDEVVDADDDVVDDGINNSDDSFGVYSVWKTKVAFLNSSD